MKTAILQLTGILCLLFTFNAAATVRYVDLNSTNATPPFTDWSTAATNIQDAVDVAVDGDLVLVTNGVYATGGRVVYGVLTNRVAITKALTVQSFNGPAVTMIQGYQVPGTISGDSAVRGVYLTNRAALVGFTVTNGATRNGGDGTTEMSGGGVWCENTNVILSNCVLIGNSAQRLWSGGGAYQGTLSNCAIIGNFGGGGGGAYGSALNNCLVSSNTAFNGGGGGGTDLSVLHNCTLSGNSTASAGGGAIACTLYNCVLSNNVAAEGGGAVNSTLNNCMLIGNRATSYSGGGGAFNCAMTNCTLIGNSSLGVGGGERITFTPQPNLFPISNCRFIGNSGQSGGGIYCESWPTTVNNCLIASNTATGFGGGAYGVILNNCTIVGNSCSQYVGGAENSYENNCIVFYNTAPFFPNNPDSGITNCCTIPIPFGSVGIITNEPLFVNLAAGDFHLQTNSPCINAGNNSFVAMSTDLDGNPRIVGGTVDIGAYEFQSPSSVLSYAWAQQYALPTDGSADFLDTDGDGLNNWQEWIAGTDPTSAASVLKMFSPSNGAPGVSVSWQSVSGKNYFLQRATNLLVSSAFSSIQSNLVGQAGTTTFSDTTATNGGPYFYRVGVQ